jgi:hypothetical protein
MKQAFESKGPEKSCEKISDGSESGPKRINRFQKGIKLFKRDLEKKDQEDSNGDEDREDDTLQMKNSGIRIRYLKEKISIVWSFGQPQKIHITQILLLTPL